MDQSRVVRTIAVPEDGLRVTLSALAPIIKGREMARRSYSEHAEANPRHIAARSMQDTIVLRWWQQTCKIVGMDADLTNW